MQPMAKVVPHTTWPSKGFCKKSFPPCCPRSPSKYCKRDQYKKETTRIALLIDRLYENGTELRRELAGAGPAMKVPAAQYVYNTSHTSRALYERRAYRGVEGGGGGVAAIASDRLLFGPSD